MNNVNTMADDQRIRVAIIDDHPTIGLALEHILAAEADMALVGSTDGVRFDMPWYRARKPNVTLIDLYMPGQNGFDLIKKIREECPQAFIIVFTALNRIEDVYKSVRLGVKGYVVKDTPIQQILDAIRDVYHGKRYFPDEVLDMIVRRLPLPDLTDRELSVLQKMAFGMNNKDIADALSISLSTVKFHVQNIIAKLGSKDRTHAVVIAVSLGMVDIGP